MKDRENFWARRIGGFFLTILGLCALGGLLGALVFPVAGKIGGSSKTHAELVMAGVKTGSFFFMVWAPGAALVREFIRGAKAKSRPAPDATATPSRDA